MSELRGAALWLAGWFTESLVIYLAWQTATFSLLRSAGAMDGLVQLHTLEASPHSITPAGRTKPAAEPSEPRRAQRAARQQQTHPLRCVTVQFRSHTGRVKVGTPLRLFPMLRLLHQRCLLAP